MAADGFVSLSRPDAGFNLIYLRTGPGDVQAAGARAGTAPTGCWSPSWSTTSTPSTTRLVGEGVEITTPLETEPWGERYFQITDPCGVVLQLVQWVRRPPSGAAAAPTTCARGRRARRPRARGAARGAARASAAPAAGA